MEYFGEERLMTEDERKVVGELAGYGEDILRDRAELFFKTRLWEESLKWDPPIETKNKQFWEPPPMKKKKGDVEEEALWTKSISFQVQSSNMPNRASWYTVKDWLPKEGRTSHPNLPLVGDKLSPIPGLESVLMQRAVHFPSGSSSTTVVTLGGPYCYNHSVYLPEGDEAGTCARLVDLAAADSDELWQDLPNMWAERDFPEVVALEGKIYVFGGQRVPMGNCFLEIYDPDSKTWKPITFVRHGEYIGPAPPLFCHVGGGSLVDDEGNRHLLFFSDPFRGVFLPPSLVTYNMETHAVDIAESPFPMLSRGAAVVVDGILYAYLLHTADIRAYDLATKRWIPGPVAGLDIDPWGTVYLKHVCGKYLCAISEDQHLTGDEIKDFSENGYKLKWRVTVFKVVQKNNDDDGGGGLEAEIYDSRAFVFPNGTILRDCIII